MNHLKISLGVTIALFAFLLYAQSISFDYAYDDGTVTKDNQLTKRGLAAVPTILKTDYWYGLGETLRGPVYRPASLIFFAIEWQLFPDNPHAFHLINVLLYAITCWLLFIVLCNLFSKQNLILPFVCTLLFVAHPIHTEVVANIKSADELLCFLFALFSIFLFLRANEKGDNLILFLATICYFISLCSKEIGISFLLIIPLLLYVFTSINLKRLMMIACILLAATGAFLLIRCKVLEAVPSINLSSPINNSLIAASNFISQKTTAIYILLRYALLLVFPHPLSCDYSFAQIPIHSTSDILALFAIIFYAAIAIYALLTIRKKSIFSFAILFYLITIAPVANIFLIIGSPMAERFLYIPSLGFCMGITLLLIQVTKTNTKMMKDTNKKATLRQFISIHPKLFIVIFIIVGLYSIKTIARSQDWRDNTSLFGHDIMVSDKSARLHYLWGNTLLNKLYIEERNADKKVVYLDQSIHEFQAAVRIFPLDIAYRDMARCYSLRGDEDNAIVSFQKLRKLNHYLDTSDAYNMSASFHNVGIQYLQKKQFEEALEMMDSALVLNPNSLESHNDKGSVLAALTRRNEAIREFQKVIAMNPKFGKAYKNIGINFASMNDFPMALNYFIKASECDTLDADNYKYIATIYQALGDAAKAKFNFDKAASLSGR